MAPSVQIQPWKQDNTVVEYMARCAEAGILIEPQRGRANFYPEGAMMFNGGQGAGDGGRQVLYDTEKRKLQGKVRGEETRDTEKPKQLVQ
ncbi:MAG: hypothetical protein MMC33_007704 [Icmadophila ericetorum]|nr:hypothetical protein [Icmadophila ericetorum]